METVKRKVCLMITKGSWGGASRYVFDIAQSLPQDQFEVTIITGSPGRLNQKLKDIGISTVALSSLKNTLNPIQNIKALKAIILALKKEAPDIIHFNSSVASLLGACAGIYLGISTRIFTVHGWPFMEDRPFLTRLFLMKLSWITALLSSHVITLSLKEKKMVRFLPLIKRKIRVIPLGIALPEKQKDRNRVRTELFSYIQDNTEPLHNPFIIGTIAELTKNKGLNYAINAIKEIPHAYYFIIGDGPEKETLSRLIQKENLTQRVFLLGFIENASSLLPGFDLFLLPSIKEGLPYVLLEAGTYQKPVIATDTGGIDSLIIDTKTGILIPPKNTPAIIRAIKEIEPRGEVYGKNLRQRIRDHFRLELMLKNIIALYR